MEDLDRDVLVATTHPELVFVDHRALGWTDRGRDEYVSAQLQRDRSLGPWTLIILEDLYTSGEVLASRYEFWSAGGRRAGVVQPGIVVTVVEADGRIVRIDRFEPDEVDAAVRLARDLDAESGI